MLMVKRLFDIAASGLAVVVLSPLLALIAIIVKLDSKGPVIFTQERIGRHFKPFRIYKFRTMVANAPALGAAFTVDRDPRITRAGRLLRHLKLDELPQLFNILEGSMSIVGPRPEVRKYVELYRGDFETVLQVRPGLTDPASLRYLDEASVLAGAADPEMAYTRKILPDKIRLAKTYVSQSSFATDLWLIVRTLVSIRRRC